MMNDTDYQYLTSLGRLLHNGVYREGRNGGTYGLFGHQMRFDLQKGFPLLTSKTVNFHAIVVELLWFLRGDTNIKFLHDHGVHIWDEWANENGDLGPVYGAQWRSWPGKPELDGVNDTYWIKDNPLDQIANVIAQLKANPYGRRHIVTAWNPAEIEDMALPPCHCLFQFYVADGKLSCQLYQRSADWFLGVPFNIASYALLTHLIAREVRLGVGEFIHSFGDYHLYGDHVAQATEQLSRDLPNHGPVAVLINPDFEKDIFELEPGDIALHNYLPLPAIKAKVSK